ANPWWHHLLNRAFDDRQVAVRQRFGHGSRYVLKIRNASALRAVGMSQLDEVGAPKVVGEGTAGEVDLLIGFHRAVGVVVEDDGDDRYLVVHGGRELLAGEEKAAIAGQRHDRAGGVRQLGANCGWEGVAEAAKTDRIVIGPRERHRKAGTRPVAKTGE